MTEAGAGRGRRSSLPTLIITLLALLAVIGVLIATGRHHRVSQFGLQTTTPVVTVTAGGAIQALAAQKLAGKVPVSGQDADLAAVKRLIAGTQTMTVYKPLKLIASEAAKLAVDLAKGTKPAFNAQYDNGKKKVDTVLLQPTLLTKSNVDIVVKDGFYTQSQLASQ